MGKLSLALRRGWPNLILGLVAVALALNCAFARHGIQDLLTLRHHGAVIEAERERLLSENAELGTIVHKLRSDEAYQQKMIRLELGFARPGEIIYRFASDPWSGAPR